MDSTGILSYEVNFLTETEGFGKGGIIEEIKEEFDLIQLWQGMMKPFGYTTREYLDRFMALSLRKMLCDKKSPLAKLCPGFLMPPLVGETFQCSGENDEMKLVQISPDIHVKPRTQWISLNEWLNTKIAWIQKDVDSLPDAYTDSFFKLLKDEINGDEFSSLFCRDEIDDNGTAAVIWRIKDVLYREKVYSKLKESGYYDLTIRRFIKHFADKQGAHLDGKSSLWIRITNQGSKMSTISVFASQMIYAATLQIDDLKDYYFVKPIMETL